MHMHVSNLLYTNGAMYMHMVKALLPPTKYMHVYVHVHVYAIVVMTLEAWYDIHLYMRYTCTHPCLDVHAQLGQYLKAHNVC